MTVKSGFINIIKEENMTSHDVVAIVRKVLGTKKVGHSGTLDPMATGVLPISVERGTKFLQYMDLDTKTYEADILFGYDSDTLDIWGSVKEGDIGSPLSEDKIKEVLLSFVGNIDQIPPMYSAIKIKGKKLYQYAREGKYVEIKPRLVKIYYIKLLKANLDKMTVTIEIKCSKGTYVRSLCRDIGKALGYSAIMSRLVRTESGKFNINDKEYAPISIEKFKEFSSSQGEEYIVDVAPLLDNLGEIRLKDDEVNQVFKFINGMRISPKMYDIVSNSINNIENLPDHFVRAYKVFGKVGDKEIFIGIGHIDENTSLKADKLMYLGDKQQ